MKRAALLALLAAGLLVAAYVAAPAGASTAASSPTQAEVVDAVTRYLELRANAALENGDVSMLRSVFATGQGATEELLAAGHREFHEHMGDFPVSSEIRIGDAVVELGRGRRAVAVVTAETTTSFSANSRRTCDDGDVTTHVIDLIVQPDRTYAVVSDDYPADGAAAYLEAANAPAVRVAKARVNEQDERSAVAASQETALAPNEAVTAASDTVAGAGVAATASDVTPLSRGPYYYSPAAAVAYANTWWNSRNSYYNNYGDNDCANFVSQCVRAGGLWQFGSSSDPKVQQWWFNHSTYRDSESWRYCPTQVDAWRWNHPHRSPRKYVVTVSSTKPSGYAKGDVAWLTSNGIETHALICTAFSGLTPLFSCHSKNRHNEPLSFWGGTHKFGVISNSWIIY